MGLLIFVSVIDAKTIEKYRSKKLNWLIDKAQELVNSYVRQRDQINDFGDFKCISCEVVKSIDQMNSGHYFPKEVKQYAAVRFDLDNLNGQCVRCNKYLSGNLIPYRENLIKKIGIRKFEQLEYLAHLKNFKHDRAMLIQIIEKYKPSK